MKILQKIIRKRTIGRKSNTQSLFQLAAKKLKQHRFENYELDEYICLHIMLNKAGACLDVEFYIKRDKEGLEGREEIRQYIDKATLTLWENDHTEVELNYAQLHKLLEIIKNKINL